MAKALSADERVLGSVQRLIAALQQQGFFGTVELKFEAGRVVLLRKAETLKPDADDYRDNRGRLDDH